jgi:hypothetical protein
MKLFNNCFCGHGFGERTLNFNDATNTHRILRVDENRPSRSEKLRAELNFLSFNFLVDPNKLKQDGRSEVFVNSFLNLCVTIYSCFIDQALANASGSCVQTRGMCPPHLPPGKDVT